MGRAKSLSVEEKARIKAYKECGLSIHQISKKTNRSRKVISRFLRDTENYGKNMKGRKVTALTTSDKRLILRLASNSHDSLAKIKEKAGVNASISTVRRVIHNATHLKFLKLKKKPVLLPQRKQCRLNFCRASMTWSREWYRIIFSDEKKFNLEGPDGYNCYFHDLRKEEHILNRLHSREGSVMVWGAITYYGTIELQFLSPRMNANSYKAVLEKAFPEIRATFGDLEWKFQHDNAPIHKAWVVKSWIEHQNVEVLEWPPYSPDLNIIENVWGWLVRKVYESGKQYSCKSELISAIQHAWSSISLDFLKKLYDSLPNRLYECILKQGGNTHY